MVEGSSTLGENWSPELDHISDQRIFATVPISPFLGGHFRTSGTPFGPVKMARVAPKPVIYPITPLATYWRDPHTLAGPPPAGRRPYIGNFIA